jgi:hypothetical protein
LLLRQSDQMLTIDDRRARNDAGWILCQPLRVVRKDEPVFFFSFAARFKPWLGICAFAILSVMSFGVLHPLRTINTFVTHDFLL